MSSPICFLCLGLSVSQAIKVFLLFSKEVTLCKDKGEPPTCGFPSFSIVKKVTLCKDKGKPHLWFSLFPVIRREIHPFGRFER